MDLEFITSWLLLWASIVHAVPYSSARRFPAGFVFGVSTASYQIEGGWEADGKSVNIWDHFTHTKPEAIADRSNGDIADDSYHLYKRDVEMLRELGVDFYRFSLSWTRILPTGFPDKINPAGVEYYNNLINELLKYNIQPMVTLYHWDLPQKLQDLGGWTNPDIVTWFSDYARVVYELFGDRVKYFITINEPPQICYYGYELETLAPGINIKGIAEYSCAKNLLVAHATAYHIYDKEFRPSQNGIIFISISVPWIEPANANDEITAADAKAFHMDQYSWPIFSKTGDFPPAMKKRVAAKSLEQGFPRSRLPEFSADEIELIKGSSDLFGLNYYVTYYVYRNSSVSFNEKPSFDDDAGVGYYQLPEWHIGVSPTITYAPWGFTKLLNYIKDTYNNIPVFITENGMSTGAGLDDDDRVKYTRGHVGAVLDALDGGCDVRGYTTWSLMDNFEWSSGYSQRFGLYEVDYGSANRTRTPRKSAFVYKELLRTRTLDWRYEPDRAARIAVDRGH